MPLLIFSCSCFDYSCLVKLSRALMFSCAFDVHETLFILWLTRRSTNCHHARQPPIVSSFEYFNHLADCQLSYCLRVNFDWTLYHYVLVWMIRDYSRHRSNHCQQWLPVCHIYGYLGGLEVIRTCFGPGCCNYSDHYLHCSSMSVRWYSSPFYLRCFGCHCPQDSFWITVVSELNDWAKEH